MHENLKEVQRLLGQPGWLPGYATLGSKSGLKYLDTIVAGGSYTEQRSGTCLLNAIKGEHLEIIKALLNAGAGINKQPILTSPLAYAIRLGHTEAAELLIEMDADISDCDNGKSALMVAIQRAANPHSCDGGKHVTESHVFTKNGCKQSISTCQTIASWSCFFEKLT